jgi:hypothetical protein
LDHSSQLRADDAKHRVPETVLAVSGRLSRVAPNLRIWAATAGLLGDLATARSRQYLSWSCSGLVVLGLRRQFN